MNIKGNQKLRPDEVVCIRALKPTTTVYRLSKVFNVSRRTISMIVAGEYYKYLPLNPEVNFSLLPLKTPGIRVCNICKESLSLSVENFYKKGRGFHYSCRQCMIRQSAENWKYYKEVMAQEKLNTQRYA